MSGTTVLPERLRSFAKDAGESRPEAVREGAAMDEADLRSYIKVVELGSVSSAAKSMFLTSQAVDARLRKLEARVGVKLLEKNIKGVSCTPAGKIFYESARNVESYMGQMLEECRRVSALDQRALRIGITMLAPLHIPQFQDTHPEINVDTEFLGTAEDIAAALQRLDAIEASDFLLDCGREDLLFTEVDKLPMCCVFSPGHPLEGKELVTLNDLVGYRVSLPRLEYLVDQLDEGLREVIQLFSLRDGVFGRGGILGAIADEGVFIMPESSMMYTSNLFKVSYAPFAGKPARFGVCMKREPSPEGKAFANFLKTVYNRQSLEER